MGRLPDVVPYWYVGNYHLAAFNTSFLTSSLDQRGPAAVRREQRHGLRWRQLVQRRWILRRRWRWRRWRQPDRRPARKLVASRGRSGECPRARATKRCWSYERDLRAPSLKCRSRPNSVIAPNPGSRMPTPTAGSVSRSSTGGSARSSPLTPARSSTRPSTVLCKYRLPPERSAPTPPTNHWSDPRLVTRPGAARPQWRTFSVLPLALRPRSGLRPVDARDVRTSGSGQVVQLSADLFDRVRAGRHLGR